MQPARSDCETLLHWIWSKLLYENSYRAGKKQEVTVQVRFQWSGAGFWCSINTNLSYHLGWFLDKRQVATTHSSLTEPREKMVVPGHSGTLRVLFVCVCYGASYQWCAIPGLTKFKCSWTLGSHTIRTFSALPVLAPVFESFWPALMLLFFVGRGKGPFNGPYFALSRIEVLV